MIKVRYRCPCAGCRAAKEIKDDPQVKAMKTLLSVKTSTSDRHEIKHYINMRRLELWKKYTR